MTIQTANTWLLNEFSKFYLRDTLSVIIDSINKDNFVVKLSEFVTANKTYAEEQIILNNPTQADILINELNSLNYELLKSTYITLYDQVDPVIPNIIPMNSIGIEYMEWLQADVNTLKRYAPDIFAGGLDANKDSTKEYIQAGLKSLSELQDDINVLKTALESITKESK